MRPDFIVRLRVGGHLPKAGPTSLEAMGRAFMNVDGTGNMADVYYDQYCSLCGADHRFLWSVGEGLRPAKFHEKGIERLWQKGKAAQRDRCGSGAVEAVGLFDPEHAP
jgi:hypothetical protein